MFVDDKPQGEAQPVKVGTIKLSDAIRRGAKIRPQCRGVFWNQATESSCAIGAALEAVGVPFGGGILGVNITNLLAQKFPTIPAARYTVIFQSNDSGLSRERIADLLAAEGL